MSLLRLLLSRMSLRRAVAGLALGTTLLAAGAFASAVPAAPQDVCLPVAGCITTTIPTVTIPTVTLPTVPTSTTTTTTTGGGTTPTSGSTGNATGATTTTGMAPTGPTGRRLPAPASAGRA